MVMTKCLAILYGRSPRRRPGRSYPGRATAAFGAPDAGLNVAQLLLGGGEQLAAFARAFVGEQRIAADDEPLARIVGRGDLGEIALVEQGKLQVAGLGRAADRRRAQRGDQVETGRFDGLAPGAPR